MFCVHAAARGHELEDDSGAETAGAAMGTALRGRAIKVAVLVDHERGTGTCAVARHALEAMDDGEHAARVDGEHRALVGASGAAPGAVEIAGCIRDQAVLRIGAVAVRETMKHAF